MSLKFMLFVLIVIFVKFLWLIGFGSVFEFIFFVDLEDLEVLDDIGKVVDWVEVGGWIRGMIEFLMLFFLERNDILGEWGDWGEWDVIDGLKDDLSSFWWLDCCRLGDGVNDFWLVEVLMDSVDGVDDLCLMFSVFVIEDEKFFDLGCIEGIGILFWRVLCFEGEEFIVGDVIYVVGFVKFLLGVGGWICVGIVEVLRFMGEVSGEIIFFFWFGRGKLRLIFGVLVDWLLWGIGIVIGILFLLIKNVIGMGLWEEFRLLFILFISVNFFDLCFFCWWLWEVFIVLCVVVMLCGDEGELGI